MIVGLQHKYGALVLVRGLVAFSAGPEFFEARGGKKSGALYTLFSSLKTKNFLKFFRQIKSYGTCIKH
jgi:hypothetical protein